jgi:hypothetical protein
VGERVGAGLEAVTGAFILVVGVLGGSLLLRCGAARGKQGQYCCKAHNRYGTHNNAPLLRISVPSGDRDGLTWPARIMGASDFQ